MTTERLRAILALPKSHPARFLALYGSSSMQDCKPVSEAEARRLIRMFTHPFGADLMACAETNS